jgi:hypothetical protein
MIDPGWIPDFVRANVSRLRAASRFISHHAGSVVMMMWKMRAPSPNAPGSGS